MVGVLMAVIILFHFAHVEVKLSLWDLSHYTRKIIITGVGDKEGEGEGKQTRVYLCVCAGCKIIP